MFFALFLCLCFSIAAFPLAKQHLPPLIVSFAQNQWEALRNEQKVLFLWLACFALAYPGALVLDWIFATFFIPTLFCCVVAYSWAREPFLDTIHMYLDVVPRSVANASVLQNTLYAPSFPEKAKKKE